MDGTTPGPARSTGARPVSKPLVGSANKERGEVDVTIDEPQDDGTLKPRTYRLRACSNQMIALERLTGERAWKVQKRFLAGEETLSDVRALLCSLCSDFHPDTTVENAGDLMDGLARLGSDEVQRVMSEVFAAGNPEPSDADPPGARGKKPRAKRKAKKKRPRGGIGGRSTGSRSGTGSRRPSSST